MAGKAEGYVEILQRVGPGSQDRIVVEAVLVVMTGPGPAHLERFKSRHPLGQPRPDRLVEIGIVDLPVEPGRLVIAGVPLIYPAPCGRKLTLWLICRVSGIGSRFSRISK